MSNLENFRKQENIGRPDGQRHEMTNAIDEVRHARLVHKLFNKLDEKEQAERAATNHGLPKMEIVNGNLGQAQQAQQQRGWGDMQNWFQQQQQQQQQPQFRNTGAFGRVREGLAAPDPEKQSMGHIWQQGLDLRRHSHMNGQ